MLPKEDSGDVEWVELVRSNTELTKGLLWEQLTFPVPDATSSPSSYEGLLLHPVTSLDTLPPLVVMPHGGPHVVTPAEFMPWPVSLSALGYAVLMGELAMHCELFSYSRCVIVG